MTTQQERDRARIDQIAKGPDPRVDFARSAFQNDVIWLLCFIAKRLI